MSGRVRILAVAVVLLAGIFLSSTMSATNSWSVIPIPQFPVGSGSWNSRVPCSSPWIVRITDITDNMTGSASLSSSIFNPGTTSPVGTAKRWLAPGATPPGWVSPGPACSIVNSHGTVALFVELDGVKRVGIVNEDCTGNYDAVNGGTTNGGSFCDSTFNIYDPAVVPNYGSSCTSATDPTCYGRIHLEIDHDWKAAHYCGPSTTCDDAALGSQTTTSSLIDFQGFIYWDPGNLNQQWHNFNGWEIHSVTAWRQHQTNPALSSSFTFSPPAPSTGTQVSFTATASGGTQPYSFTWSFGDGSTGTGSSTTHTYTVAGSYNVVLTVKDNSSPQQTVTSQQTVNVANPPPPLTASYTFSPSSPGIGQSVTFTGAASGGTSPYTFNWNFGDGTSGSGNPASHAFSTSRTFTVQLSVVDSSGTTASTTHNVTVSPPSLSASFSFSPSSPTTGQTLSFTGSATGGTPPYAFSWLFGDGATGTGNPVSHSYSTSGSFSVQVNATDAAGKTATASKTVMIAAPLSVTSFVPSTGTVGTPITASATASGGTSPYTFSWSFGDGTANVAGATPSHTYTVAGSYSVKVNATDGVGRIDSTSSTIIINPAPLTTDFTYTPTIVQTGTSVTFTATTSGGTSPYSYSWSFGDGRSTTGSPVSHSYAISGNFTVQLLVTDFAGANATASHTITVTQPPPPDFTITSNPSTAQIIVGGSGSSTITLTSTGGFAGTINLSTTISPSGPITSLSPTFVTLSAGGSATARLTVTTQFTTPTGNYTVTITGNSTSLSHSTTVLVMVRLAPDFSLTTSATSITVPRTNSGTVSLTLASLNGFNGTVNVSVTVSPSGPKTSLVSSSVRLAPGATANDMLTIKALKKTPVGTYTVTVTATSGTVTHSTTITVTVT